MAISYVPPIDTFIRVVSNAKVKHFAPIGAIGKVYKYGSLPDRARVAFDSIQAPPNGISQWVAYVDMEPYEGSNDVESESWDE